MQDTVLNDEPLFKGINVNRIHLSSVSHPKTSPLHADMPILKESQTPERKMLKSLKDLDLTFKIIPF